MPKKQGNHDDLHHRHRAYRRKDVAREHVDNLVHHRQVRRLNGLRCGGRADVDSRQDALQQTGNNQPQRHRKDGGRHEVKQGAETEFSHLRDIVHRQNARHDGEQHQRHHDEFQQIKEDDAEGLNVGIDEIGIIAQEDTGDYGQH